jgi:tripartite-type tricarboxylate transporter receptor subunit TctC
MKTTGIVIALLLALAASGHAQQPQYPAKPVRMMVEQAAGGVLDVLGRVLAENMAKDLGRPVIVENRPGADGLIGMEYLARSPNDGYSIGLGSQSTLAIEPQVRSTMPYNAVSDFTPIAVIVDNTGGLGWFVHSSLPFTTLTDMVAYAKANPGKLNFATTTSSTFMLGSWVAKRAGIDIVSVPYKIAPQAAQDTVAGVVNMMITSTSTLEPFVKTGQVRVLAVSSPRRLDDWKDVPTVSETFPDFAQRSWVVLVAPAGVPSDIVQRLNRAVAVALKEPQYLQQVKRIRWLNEGGARTPRETEEFIRAGREEWRRVLQVIGRI